LRVTFTSILPYFWQHYLWFFKNIVTKLRIKFQSEFARSMVKYADLPSAVPAKAEGGTVLR